MEDMTPKRYVEAKGRSANKMVVAFIRNNSLEVCLVHIVDPSSPLHELYGVTYPHGLVSEEDLES